MSDLDTSPGTPAPLQTLRTQIDALDRELLALLNRRARLALEVGELKKREGSPVFRPEREAQVIDGLKKANPGPLPNDCVAPIWREIMSASRALEAPTRVAYLGPAGTFSELAALGYHQACAGITLPNEGSVALHESVGFKPVGVFRDIGFKFGAWRDVGYWQCALQPAGVAGEPAEPRVLSVAG